MQVGLNYGSARRGNDTTDTGMETSPGIVTRTADIRRPQWFVMRAYKCEGKAERRLAEDGGLEYFIPKRYAVRSYHGVKSRRLVPAIPSLVFVRASREQIVRFKRDNNFLQYIMRRSGGVSEAMTVPDSEMDNFIRVSSHPEENLRYLRPEEINLRKGARIRVIGGVFDGVEGVFVKTEGVRDRRVVVLLEGILAVSVQIHPDLIEVLPQEKQQN